MTQTCPAHPDNLLDLMLKTNQASFKYEKLLTTLEGDFPGRFEVRQSQLREAMWTIYGLLLSL